MILLLNEEYILKLIKPYLNKNREISEFEFNELFFLLTKLEQYEIINIFIKNNIDYVDEKTEESKVLDDAIILRKAPPVNYKNLMNLTNEQLCVMAQSGDDVALSALLEKNKRFIYQMALKLNKQYHQNCMTLEDLFQEGVLGMIEAVNKFDLNKDFKFLTYSWHWIRQKIIRAIVNDGYLIRIPVHLFDQMAKIVKFRRNNPEVSLKEIAQTFNEYSEKEIVNLLMLAENYLITTSLNSLIGEDQSTELEEVLPIDDEISVEDIVISNALKKEIQYALNKLTDREKTVMELRFGINSGSTKTLEEVGMILGVTRERIRQIEGRSFRKLRNPNITKHLEEFLY